MTEPGSVAWGVRIETLDTPGWLVEIHLVGTPLEAVEFTLALRDDDEREWIDCRVTAREI